MFATSTEARSQMLFCSCISFIETIFKRQHLKDSSPQMQEVAFRETRSNSDPEIWEEWYVSDAALQC